MRSKKINTLKIIVLSGIPASGKSTWARKFIKNNSGKWVIVSRDSIRDMLGKYWVPKREGLVSDIEIDSIINALGSGFNVIVDATHIGHKAEGMIQKIFGRLQYEDIEECNVTVEIKVFDVPLWKAIYRDWRRGLFGGRSVGSKVIKKFNGRL